VIASAVRQPSLLPAMLEAIHAGKDIVAAREKDGKHSGMPALLVRDEATGGLHGKSNPTATRS
jgi:hypothetical protein